MFVCGNLLLLLIIFSITITSSSSNIVLVDLCILAISFLSLILSVYFLSPQIISSSLNFTLSNRLIFILLFHIIFKSSLFNTFVSFSASSVFLSFGSQNFRWEKLGPLIYLQRCYHSHLI